jgi:hypothetical protein
MDRITFYATPDDDLSSRIGKAVQQFWAGVESMGDEQTGPRAIDDMLEELIGAPLVEQEEEVFSP